MGLFWYDRYKSVAEAVINLVASIILGKLYGVAGVFLGTLIGMASTSLWIEPYVLYKYKIKENVLGYYLKFLLYGLITAALFLGETYVCSLLPLEGFGADILRTVFCFVITNLVFLLLYFRTKEFIFLRGKFIGLVNSKFKKNK